MNRMQPNEVEVIIEEFCSQSEIELNKQDRTDLETICYGNLVAIKWILGQLATENMRLDLIIEDLQANSNIYILDHIFEFTFSRLNPCSKVVLLTLANAPVDVTGNLITNSVYCEPDEVEKSLGILVKYGLVTELKNEQGATGARISLLSEYRISLITCNYAKSKSKELNDSFPRMLIECFFCNLRRFDSNSKEDKTKLADFLVVWADVAITFLEKIHSIMKPKDIIRVYVFLRPFRDIVYSNPQRLPVAGSYVKSNPYNTDLGQTFIKFGKNLLIFIDEHQARTGSPFFIRNTLHLGKGSLKLNEIVENLEFDPCYNNLVDRDDLYKDYMQIRSTIAYKKEDLTTISYSLK